MTATITAELYPATNIQEGQTYLYIAAGRCTSTITISRVRDGRATATAKHWEESWTATFDAETGKGLGDYENAQLAYLL